MVFNWCHWRTNQKDRKNIQGNFYFQISPFIQSNLQGRSVLEGKMVALGEKQDCTFMDVVCAQGDGQYIFAVTEDGFLIQVDRMYGYFFHSNKIWRRSWNRLGQIGKWVNMKTQSAFGLSATPNYISIACTDGISRVFNPENLQYVSTLPNLPKKSNKYCHSFSWDIFRQR